MKHKLIISKTDADEASHHGTPRREKSSRIQTILLGCAVASMIAGMVLWILRQYVTFLFFGLGILLMITVYTIEFRRTK